MPVSVLAPREHQRLHLPVDLHTKSAAAWPDIVQSLKTGLLTHGFDVLQPLCLSWYNTCLPKDSGARIPTREGTGAQDLVVIVGNSKSLWPCFLKACRQDPELLAHADPLDTYVEDSVQSSIQPLTSRHPCKCYWSHSQSEELAGTRYIAIQRMAHAAGLAFLEPNSHLCLHPKFGSWLALRCALVFEGVAYTGPRPSLLMSPLSTSTEHYVQMAMKTAQRKPSIDLTEPGGKPKRDRTWLKWVAVRDALCPCHPWRYCDDQIKYHYTKDRAVLEAAVIRR